MLTTILFLVGLVLLWRKPSWGRVAWFSVLIAASFFMLVWISAGLYANAARDVGRVASIVGTRALIWAAAFAFSGGLIVAYQRRRDST